MNAHNLQNLCISGTDAYLRFLLENNLGVERIRVIRKEALSGVTNPTFKLTLAARLFDPDCVSLELTPPTQTYGPDYFQVVEYDGDAKVLIIQVLNPELVLDARPPEDVWIVSDLRFLVRNVRRWYASNGLQLQLPQNAPAIQTVPPIAIDQDTIHRLDPCQSDAVAASLGNPVTYVWGPPGTGKTKHVLTQAVLRLVHDQRRIGIFAPTNNALEQAMEAILHASETAGIGRDKFLRVGHPSTKFAKAFPEVCEVQGLERRISEIEGQIEVYEKVLHHRRGATALNSVATLRHEISQLQTLLHRRRRTYEELARKKRGLLSRTIHILDGTLRSLDEALALLEAQIDGQLEMIRRMRTESPKLNAIVERLDFTNVDQIEEAVTDLANATQHYTEVNQALADEYKGQPDEEIQRQITKLREQLVALKAQTVLEKVKSALVVGMTLDCFIARFHDTLLPFDHIFIDEAGYAPLVKALTLCRGGIPLTFIGDHKQLGPVCEMKDENLNAPANYPAIVWKKSALFVDQVFLAEDHNAFTTQAFQLNEPRMECFARAHLNKTFRFGQNLAHLLSAHVYHGIELLSAEDHQDLEIVQINAVPTQQPVLPRQNRAEADAISSYLNEHMDLDDTREGAFVILTPYKNQVHLLSDTAGSLVDARRQGRIMTVHKAQGREWDTVILSIVDGRFNCPWFTDSTNRQSGGLHVMNTAISRARKRLVVVSDVGYWLRPHMTQLVTDLLKLATQED